MSELQRVSPDLQTLVDIFYESPAALGEFEEAKTDRIPTVYRGFLEHNEHMTVAVEDYHRCKVDVQVLQKHTTATHYSRKILLTRQTDGQVVQFGIVRLNLDYLGAEVRREIESEQIPLGRVLISHNVLRTVRLLSLWRITPGEDLRKLFSLHNPETCYGRTALIYCNNVPAVELLEIVTPAQ